MLFLINHMAVSSVRMDKEKHCKVGYVSLTCCFGIKSQIERGNSRTLQILAQKATTQLQQPS